MKEKYEKDKNPVEYTPDTHPFGRAPEEMPVLKTRWERFSYWFKNKFWFHYKWYVAAGLFVALLAAIFIRDMVTNYKPDFQYAVITYQYVDEENLAEMTALAENTFGDSNGDNQIYSLGHAAYMGYDGELGMAMYSKVATFFMEDGLALFIFDTDMYDNYFDVPEGFVDLSALGYETVAGKPWLLDLTGLPILERNGMTDTYYAAVQAAKEGDEITLEAERQAIEFLALIVKAQ